MTTTLTKNPEALQRDGTATSANGSERRKQYARPHYEVVDRNDVFEVQVLMPGVKKDGLEISFEGDRLTIEGTRSDTVPETWRPIRRSGRPDGYQLELQLNIEVDNDNITAQLEDGILCLKLPKSETIKPRRIPVQ